MGAVNAYQFDRGIARVSLTCAGCGHGSHDCLASLLDSIHAIEEDSRVSAVYFALSGGDIEEVGGDTEITPVLHDTGSEDKAGLPRLFKEIRGFPLPLVSTIKGRVSFKDAAVFLASDLVLMDSDAEIAIDAAEDDFEDIASLLKRRLPPELAQALASGKKLSASQALAGNLCDFVVPSGELPSMAVSLAGRLGNGPGEMLTLIQAEAMRGRS